MIPARRPPCCLRLCGPGLLSSTRKKPRWVPPLELPQTGGGSDVSKDAVHRVWREADLKPHRLERYLASDDPDFERKATDILGLYLRPPQHAAVFCVDERTTIQALDRLDPGRQEIHIILDNLAAHKTQRVHDFLARHSRVRFHSTPTYSSSLNQVELWSTKIEREVIARAIFTPVPDLARNSGATLTPTQPTLAPSGNTLTLLAVYVLTNSL
jgi:hypothetical protein